MMFRRKKNTEWEGDIHIVDEFSFTSKKRCYCNYMDVDEAGEFHLKYLGGGYAEN